MSDHIVEPNKMVFTHIDVLAIHSMMSGRSVQALQSDRSISAGARNMAELVQDVSNPVHTCREMLRVMMLRERMKR